MKLGRRGGVVSIAVAVVVLLAWALSGGDRPERTDRSTASTDDGSGPAEREAAEREAEAPAKRDPPADTLHIYALENGEPIEGVVVHLGFDAGDDVTASSDPDGELELGDRSLQALSSLRIEGAPDLTLASTVKDARRERQVWCFRSGVVTGRVVFEGGEAPPFSEVELDFAPPLEGSTGSTGPGSMIWMRGRRVLDRKTLGSPDAEGRFRLKVPYIQGAVIMARASGWAPGWAVIKPRSELVVVLRRAYRIKGTLKDRAGQPIADETVRIYVVKKTKYDDTAHIGRVKNAGYTVKRSMKDDETVHTLVYTSQTDKNGEWMVDAGMDGDVYAIAYLKGRSAIELHLGKASTVVREIRLKSEQTAPQRILIVKDGRPLKNASLHAADMTLVDAQPAFSLTTDATGFVETTWLTRGKHYALFKGGAAFLKYTGQQRIDLDACESNFDTFVAQHGLKR